jgi:hypothetical protein
MTRIRTRILVTDDHRISGAAPSDLPPGEHEAVIIVPARPRFLVSDLPVHPGAWDDRISTRREDIYGDDA